MPSRGERQFLHTDFVNLFVKILLQNTEVMDVS